MQQRGATPSCPKLERRFVDDTAGCCLIATEDIEGEEVMLSVPLTAAITSEGADESRWSAHMAWQLLQQQAAGDDGRGIAPWISVLPRYVDLPWLYWSEEELAELQDEDTLAEAAHLRSLYDAACQVCKMWGSCALRRRLLLVCKLWGVVCTVGCCTACCWWPQ